MIRHLPGVALAVAVATLATVINAHVSLLSALLVAILLGLALRNLHLVPASAEPGLTFTGKTILRVGVVLLGLRLSIPAVIALGWGAVGVIVLTVASVFLATLGLGRLLGVPHATSLLTATGTAICGAAAVAGMSAVVRPDPTGMADGEAGSADDVEDAAATAIASVTLFGTLAILVLPVLARGLDLAATRSGVWIGASVHEVGQVVAAAGLMGSAALDVAVLTKLGRVVLLAPLVAIMGVVESRRAERLRRLAVADGEIGSVLAGDAVDHAPATAGRAPLVPFFVLGFLIMVAVRSVGGDHLPATLLTGADRVATFLLTMAMCAMGAGVNLRRLAATGLRALGLGALAGVVSAVVSLAGVLLLVR